MANFQKETVDIPIPIKERMGYQIDEECLKKSKVKLFLFKGTSHADPEGIITGQRVMFRLKIKFQENLKKYMPVDSFVAKEVMESVDLDIGIFEEFLEKLMRKEQRMKTLSVVREMVLDKKIKEGSFLATLTMSYHNFSKIVSFLKLFCYEGLRKDL